VLLAQVNYPGFGQREVTYSLQTVFATYPLLVSYTDELGTTRELTYPLTGGLLPVVDGPDADSDIEVTLNFWRPQRRAIPEEVQSGTEWVDVGGLQYFVDLVSPGGPGCPESSFAESDPNLSLNTIKGKGGILDPPLSDSAPDRPASPTNTFTFTLNLSDCLAANGFPKEPPGGRGTVGFGARLPDALNYVGYQIGFQAVP
jgi:hypothetical protein